MSTIFPAGPVASAPPLLVLLPPPPQAPSAAAERIARHPAIALLKASLIQRPRCRFRASMGPGDPECNRVPVTRQANACGLTQVQSRGADSRNQPAASDLFASHQHVM